MSIDMAKDHDEPPGKSSTKGGCSTSVLAYRIVFVHIFRGAKTLQGCDMITKEANLTNS